MTTEVNGTSQILDVDRLKVYFPIIEGFLEAHDRLCEGGGRGEFQP